MNLGAFSVSLTVKNIDASSDFYQKLGFQPFAGESSQGWLMLRNGEHVLGLFQGMFEKNMMTFNPGWNQQCEVQDSFTDVRQLQQQLHEKGIATGAVIDEGISGPGSFSITDPDGNTILIDQHC